LKRFINYHLPVLLYAGLIVTFSSIPNLKTPKIIDLQVDKVAHFFEYAILAFLSHRSLIHLESKTASRYAYHFSAIFVAIFAALDELHQCSVPGRDAGLGDLSMDLAGAALVLILLWYRGKDRN